MKELPSFFLIKKQKNSFNLNTKFKNLAFLGSNHVFISENGLINRTSSSQMQ